MNLLNEILLNYESGYTEADCVNYMQELLEIGAVEYEEGKEVLNDFYDIIGEV